VLKTRRSLRAVHFHPHGAPLLLTAEVSVRLVVFGNI
jgi:activator-of-BECN1-regulated-autophagy protein 1